MSQRNPLNERNQNDTKAGKTRKSAASAKPVTKAASSVYIADPNNKPKEGFLSRLMGGGSNSKKQEEEAKARAKAAKTNKEATSKEKGAYTLLDMEGDTEQKKRDKTLTKADRKEAQRRYNNPGTSEYKKWRIIWWVVIGLGICSLIPPLVRPDLFVDNENTSLIFYGLGWAFLLAAVGIDALKIRPLRKEARAGASKDKSKAATAARKEMRKQEALRAEEESKKQAEKQAKKAAKKAARGK